MDWSFGLVIALVAILVAVLVVRHMLVRRQQRHAEKRARHAAYKAWLDSSGMEMPRSGRRKR